MKSFITIRELDINTYNISEYVRLLFYLLSKNNIALIKREFYLIDNLITKTLIEINIIKSKEIVFNVIRNVIIVILYKNLKIFITFTSYH